MARTKEEIRLYIRGDTKQVEQSLKGLCNQMGKVKTKGSGLGSLFKTGLGMGIGIAAFQAGTRALGNLKREITSTITQTAKMGDTFAKMSKRVGISVESLSQLKHAAELSGTSLAGMETGFRRLSANIVDASRGLAESKREFEALGIAVKDSKGELRATEDILLEVAEKFSKMKDGTVKAAAATKLLGRSGMMMIPMLNEGAKGIKNMMKEADQLGFTMSTKTAKAAELFNDNWLRIKGAMTGVKQLIGAALLPYINKLSSAFVNWVKVNKDNIQSVVIKGLQGIIPVLGYISQGIGYVIKGFRWWTEITQFTVDMAMQGFELILGGITKLVGGLDWLARKLGIDTFSGWESSVELFTTTIGLMREQSMGMFNTMQLGMNAVGEGFVNLGEKARTFSVDLQEITASTPSLLDHIIPGPDKAEERIEALKLAMAQGMAGFQEEMLEPIREASLESNILGEMLGLTPDSIENWEIEPETFELIFEKINGVLEEQREVLAQQAAKILGIDPESLAQVDMAGLQNMMGIIATENKKAAETSGKAWQTGLGGVSGMFSNITSAVQSESGKQKGIAKAASIAQTMVKTYQAATSAYAAMSGIPIIGPALGVAAAAAAIAAGLANVAKIRSAKKGGIVPLPPAGGFPGLGPGAVPIVAHAGERIIPAEQAGDTFQHTTNVTFQGDFFGEQEFFDEKIVPMIQDAQARDVDMFA